MQIKCQTLGDMLVHLRAQSTNVLQNTIYVDAIRNPLNGTCPSDCSSWEIEFSANCILTPPDAIESLLFLLEYCGIDRSTANVSTEGTDAFTAKFKELTAFCTKYGLTIMPGSLEI